MTRTALACGLAAFLLGAGTALALPVGSKSSTPQAKRQDRNRDRHCGDDDRTGDRFDRFQLSSASNGRRPGYQRPGAPPRLPMYGEVTRDCRPVRHSSSCSCSPCRRKGQRRGEDRRVLVKAKGAECSETVAASGRGRDGRHERRGSGRDSGFSWDNDRYRQTRTGNIRVGDTQLRVHADGDCREPGTVLASSGTLYVQVRADGRLTIRSR